MIIESGQEAATNTDILNGTRIATAPRNGVMLFQMSADVCVEGTNDAKVSLQLPGGDNPLDGVLIPAATTAGSIDDRQSLQVEVPVQQGGQVLFSVVETGAIVFTWRVTFR